MRKVIFDSDPGVDDAMAILFLASQPDVQLLAITTVFGNHTIDVTTRNALYLVESFDIPAIVSKGAASPLVGLQPATVESFHGVNGLGGVELDEISGDRIDPRPAHQLIIDLVNENPGEVSIIAVGRMTNLALALSLEPEIVSKVKEIVVMGGAFGFFGHSGNITPIAEANIHGDAVAADKVFSAAWPLSVVGLDVTQKTIMSHEYLERLADVGGRAGKFMRDITRVYEDAHFKSGETRGIYVHDSSAVAYFLDRNLFERREGPLLVSTVGVTIGQTIQKPNSRLELDAEWDQRPTQTICTNVDEKKLLELFQRSIVNRWG